jgi:hypothetical protein
VGDGVYTMDIYDKYWSPQATEVHGLFNITYNPPITEMINEITPTGLSAHKFDIQVPTEITGFFDPGNGQIVDQIYQHFKNQDCPLHSFDFTDKDKKKQVTGSIGAAKRVEKSLPPGNPTHSLITNTTLILEFDGSYLTAK